jgi:hypothetical protein
VPDGNPPCPKLQPPFVPPVAVVTLLKELEPPLPPFELLPPAPTTTVYEFAGVTAVLFK